MSGSVVVKNICGNRLGITNPETKTVRVFPANGQKTMSIEEIRNLYWGDDGFAYMIREKYLEVVNPPQELAEDLELTTHKVRTPQELIKLNADEFAATLPTLLDGEKSALEQYLQDNDFPISLAQAAKQFFGRDFLMAKQIAADSEVKPGGFVRKG